MTPWGNGADGTTMPATITKVSYSFTSLNITSAYSYASSYPCVRINVLGNMTISSPGSITLQHSVDGSPTFGASTAGGGGGAGTLTTTTGGGGAAGSAGTGSGITLASIAMMQLMAALTETYTKSPLCGAAGAGNQYCVNGATATVGSNGTVKSGGTLIICVGGLLTLDQAVLSVSGQAASNPADSTVTATPATSGGMASGTGGNGGGAGGIILIFANRGIAHTNSMLYATGGNGAKGANAAAARGASFGGQVLASGGGGGGGGGGGAIVIVSASGSGVISVLSASKGTGGAAGTGTNIAGAPAPSYMPTGGGGGGGGGSIGAGGAGGAGGGVSGGPAPQNGSAGSNGSDGQTLQFAKFAAFQKLLKGTL